MLATVKPQYNPIFIESLDKAIYFHDIYLTVPLYNSESNMLRDMPGAGCYAKATHDNINLFIFLLATENLVDGETLCMLKSNFDEFKHLVPQSGLRIKIKSLIEAEANNSIPQV